MGIRMLKTYVMETVVGSSKTVNIIQELQNFKKIHQADPVIVINLWTLSHNYNFNRKEKVLGFHLNTFQEELEEFLKKLVDQGAKLIFVFKKNQYLEADFSDKTELEYQNSCEILNVMEILKDFDSIIHYFENHSKFYFPPNQQILLMMMETAKKYGTIQGMESTGCKPSTAHARIANQMNAMAIIGLDTYYLFYGGTWKFWSDGDLDMKSMTILEYDKKVILKSLNLTTDQVPLFVVLAGGLYSSPENVMLMGKKFKFWDSNYFQRISAVVNQQKFPLDTADIIDIVVNIFGRFDVKIVADFKNTLDLMDPDNHPKYPKGFDQDILKISDNELMNYANEILLNKSIFISPNFDDLRTNDMTPLSSLVAPWLQRTAGILLMHQNDFEPRKLLLKEAHDSKLAEIQIIPTIPSFDCPPLKELVNGEFSREKADEMMKWIFDIDFDIDDVPEEYLGALIILVKLVRTNALNPIEADLVLQTIVDVKKGKIPKQIKYPEKINTRAVRVSYFYSKVYMAFHSCLAAVGVKHLQNEFAFDNVHFQGKFTPGDDIFNHLKRIIT